MPETGLESIGDGLKARLWSENVCRTGLGLALGQNTRQNPAGYGARAVTELTTLKERPGPCTVMVTV